MDYEAIAQAALSRAETIVTAAFPNGKRQGNEYVALNPNRADKSLGSFAINLRTGKWGDFASGTRGGDLISLLAYRDGCSQSEAARRIAEGVICAPLQNTSYPTPKVAKATNVQPYVSALWGDTMPIEGTPGEVYLRGRGITGKIPESIRFITSLRHKPSGTRWSAMIAGVQRYPDKSVVALHRTWVAKDCKGKAPVEPNKMMLGAVGGSAVRFGSLQPVLVVAEGLETALSIYGEGYTVWAVLSASNFKSLILPPVELVREIIIAADNDDSGAGLDAAYKAAELWGGQGRIVRVAIPPKGLDFNDVLRVGL